MPKNTPFIPPTCPEEMAGIACRNAHIAYDSPQGKALLEQIRRYWQYPAPPTEPSPHSYQGREAARGQNPSRLKSPALTTPSTQAQLACNKIEAPLAEDSENAQPSVETPLELDQHGGAGVQNTEQRANNGRPENVKPFYDAVAFAMRDGTTLRQALKICGVELSEHELQNLVRRKSFQRRYQAERRKYDLKRFCPAGVDPRHISEDWLAGQSGSNAARVKQRGRIGKRRGRKKRTQQ